MGEFRDLEQGEKHMSGDPVKILGASFAFWPTWVRTLIDARSPPTVPPSTRDRATAGVVRELHGQAACLDRTKTLNIDARMKPNRLGSPIVGLPFVSS
jgi:hypothetical protein